MWQLGRFEDDIEFWRKKLGPEPEIEPVKDGDDLRFYLATEEDFKQFRHFLKDELPQLVFLGDCAFDEQADGS